MRNRLGSRDRAQIQNRRAAWYEHQVGYSCGSERRGFSVRSSVDEAQDGTVLPCGREDLREPRGLGGDDDWGFGLARVGPSSGASLGVEVNDERCVPGKLGGHGQVERQGRFAHATFL